MIGRIELALLFALLAVINVNAEESLAVYDDEALQAQVQDYSGNYINVNKLFDKIHPRLHDLMVRLDMDPLKLIDFTEPVTKLPGKLAGKMEFTNGYMHGMSYVRRTQDVSVKYEGKVLTLNMDLGWKRLDFNYQYYYEHLLIKRSGHVFGKLTDVDVNVRIRVNFNTYKLELDNLKFMRVGDMEITLQDNEGDRFLNGILKAITKIFHRTVLNQMHDVSVKIFNGVLDEFNKKIPRPTRVRILENFDEMMFHNTFYRLAENIY